MGRCDGGGRLRIMYLVVNLNVFKVTFCGVGVGRGGWENVETLFYIVFLKFFKFRFSGIEEVFRDLVLDCWSYFFGFVESGLDGGRRISWGLLECLGWDNGGDLNKNSGSGEWGGGKRGCGGSGVYRIVFSVGVEGKERSSGMLDFWFWIFGWWVILKVSYKR